MWKGKLCHVGTCEGALASQLHPPQEVVRRHLGFNNEEGDGEEYNDDENEVIMSPVMRTTNKMMRMTSLARITLTFSNWLPTQRMIPLMVELFYSLL